MKSDKMLWKCYTVYNEHLKRDFTTILRDCTQSPNKTLYLSNELQNFSIPSLIFFSLSILTTSNTVALLRFSSLHAFFSFSENFSFFSTNFYRANFSRFSKRCFCRSTNIYTLKTTRVIKQRERKNEISSVIKSKSMNAYVYKLCSVGFVAGGGYFSLSPLNYVW